eukprot:Protomagalhaensia_wolfi_Nauph_80__1061@NODE_1618_length_1440_cov_113_633119_g1253_i0_p1_GENE_NODE_1618_length_1440_cov_113_633119_g1253_i0NODE_1618_length_1440_cov_113_633119_g1253_i0_p1_ORF_typecomplete_len302_score26_03IF4E/PF01652_18/1_1e30_NODE_1618_length_1440_cov_113_633119_g1253_i04331338
MANSMGVMPERGDAAMLSSMSDPMGCQPADVAPLHLLETEWTIWSYPRVTGSKITALCHQQLTGAEAGDTSPASAAANLYAADLQVRSSFNTVEGFFAAWESMQRPSAMPTETNIAIFRGQLKPMWEAFPNGGRYVIRLRRPSAGSRWSSRTVEKGQSTIADRDSPLASFVDHLWENIVFRLIGETFELPEVVGAVCSMRTREAVFSVWITDAEHLVLRHRIRAHLQKVILESQASVNVEEPDLTLLQFNAFSSRLHEQQRDILAKGTRSLRKSHNTISSESAVARAQRKVLRQRSKAPVV